MKRFAELFRALDETNKASAKKQALVDYFSAAPAEDCAWATAFLIGDRPKRTIPTAALVEAAMQKAAIPAWLFNECHEMCGDFSETMALLLPDDPGAAPPSLSTLIRERMLKLKDVDKAAAVASIVESWSGMGANERLVWNKLLTGQFRVGVAKGLVVQALADVAHVDKAVIAARMTGGFEKSEAGWTSLIKPDEAAKKDPARPYPFFLASPIPGAHPRELGAPSEFLIEQKWDGIRSQVVVRDVVTEVRRGSEGDAEALRRGTFGVSPALETQTDKKVWLWSRGEEEISAGFPDVIAAARKLPSGTVIDGELVVWKDGIRSFNDLQQRLNRKKPTEQQQQELPCQVLCYDLLEENGVDLRALPIVERRQKLEAIASAHGFQVSPTTTAATWEELDAEWRSSRERGVEGFMLKRKASPYRAGRVRGDWWKWKVAPLSVDCVLVYAQKGSGRRAGLYSDYTFAVWSSSDPATRKLVTFAKAYSGLTDEELKQVDAFIKRHTLDRHGPVRVVEPTTVVELGFEGIAESTRHKSGFAVRFPRILRLRPDKKADEADTVDTLRGLLNLVSKTSV